MQIVIDIDDNLYTRLFDNGKTNVMDMRRACVAIQKGTVLPKSHGKLKDVDKIIEELGCEDEAIIFEEILREAPIIIEADKGGEK